MTLITDCQYNVLIILLYSVSITLKLCSFFIPDAVLLRMPVYIFMTGARNRQGRDIRILRHTAGDVSSRFNLCFPYLPPFPQNLQSTENYYLQFTFPKPKMFF